MISKRMLAMSAVVVAALCAPLSVLTQTSPSPGQMKEIGVASNAKQIVPSLIVMNSRGATLQGATLTLIGVSPNAIIFADRPVRSAGHALTAHLLEEWAPGSESFAQDPPNATVSVFNKDASTVKDAVVVLKAPKLDGDKLTFDVQVLEGDLANADGPASVFIDIIGLPRTPLSFAGVARRTAYRGAFYGAAGAAAVAGAAAAGAYAYRPYGYPYAPAPYAPACGYYPYPPCY
jgi:hypothetical protein